VVVNLQEFFDYKNRLMHDLLTNEKIVNLIAPDIEFEDAESLAYKQVYPFEYIPEVIENGYTYVCFDVDIASTYNKTFYEPTLYVWVMVQDSQLRLPTGGVRVDMLCSEICKAINGSRYYSLGELNFDSCRRFSVVTRYTGKALTFRGKDYNRQHDGKKFIPSNRKE